MKYNILSTILLLLVGCQPSRDHLPSDNKPKDVHSIYKSQKWMNKNIIENWIEGEWIQTDSEHWLSIYLAPYLEFSFNNIEGKWIIIIISRINPRLVSESSYKIEKDYWSIGAHILFAEVNKFTSEASTLLWYPEIEKINEDKIKVYIRGFDRALLPPDFDWENPDPKLSVRGEGAYAVYQRVK